jgi:endoglucanase
VLDCTPAYDLPHWEVDRGKVEETVYYNTQLGKGAAIYIADKGMISDPRLVKHFIQVAEEQGIPYQIRQAGGGGTDGGAIHLQHEGIPTIAVSVPARYLHTPYSLAEFLMAKCIILVHAALMKLTPELLMRTMSND